MEKIVNKLNVWDLHIHTPLGTLTQKNYDNASNEDFINNLIHIFGESKYDVGMISFTDHNKINAEAYELFMEKSDIAIIPGIEVDIYLSEKDKKSKHIIFYFDEAELQNINSLKAEIEGYIDENKRVIFEDFVMYLLGLEKHFAISPHAFKQGERGINSGWADEYSANRGTNEFTGLFFSFWETSGKTEICRALEFLNNQYSERKKEQAVIAFSDSSNYENIKRYLEKPHQFFDCLNTFKGLLLAGSDLDRIKYTFEEKPGRYPSEKIKLIKLSNNLQKRKKKNTIEIELSDRLNVIIGGRGQGKSALLDAIVCSIDENKIELLERRDFVKKFDLEIRNYRNALLPKDTNILYYSQLYIGKLFDGKSQTKLNSFFEKEFSYTSQITDGQAELLAEMDRKTIYNIPNDVNLNDVFNWFIYIKDEKILPSIKGVQFSQVQLREGRRNYYNIIKKYLPNDKDLWDEELENGLKDFVGLLLKKICIHNYNNIISSSFATLLEEKIDKKKMERDEKSNLKIESKRTIRKKLEYLYSKELERIRQINNLYEIDSAITRIKMDKYVADGAGNNKFCFVSVANMEHPVEFANRMIIEYVNKNRLRNFDKRTYYEVFKEYATSQTFESKIKETMEFSDLVDSINKLNGIKCEKIHKILYFQNNEVVDLHKSSPGTQTNAIMEYIMHSESTIPLFIDQPEDNIDNEAIYSQLTKWIREQKYKRQIILVTHDANIVINGDAENVIIAEHTPDFFSYQYGALEYDDILDRAAVILDGGKTAIHRRIEKYGE